MNETTGVAARRITSADLYAQARELQAKADEQDILGEDAGDAIRRQFHSSARNAYALWAIEIEKIAATLEMMEQRIDNQSRPEIRDELSRPEQR